MIVREVALKDFRNYQTLNIMFDDGLNVLVGENAQGKTNLLESIFLCAIGKSPRTSKDKEMIAFGKHMAKVTTKLSSKLGSRQIEIFLFDNQKKAIKIEGTSILKMGELLGELHAVYFSPDQLKLVKDSPQERRRFLDISLCQYDKKYFYTLTKYNQILSQRNELLKTKGRNLEETLSIWNEELAICGAKIIEYRMQYVEKLSKFAKSIAKYLTSDKENLCLSYAGVVADNAQDLKEKLLQGYQSTFGKDVELGYTTIGPHRDDIKIVLNDIDVRYFGSQGQQRTCALALKLAELEIFKENTGEYPVLLLDDVLSELDETRKVKLLEYVAKLQTILTCTSFPYDIQCKKYIVSQGTIKNNES